MTGRLADERGASTTIELVILAPAFGLVIALLVLAGRLALAEQALDGAAQEAARAVSLQRGASTDDATAAARTYLSEQDLRCGGLSVDIDVAAKESDPGTSGDVTATVSCTVALADLALPGVGGGRELTAVATSPVDVYRER